MGLYERLGGGELVPREQVIPVHLFWCVMQEFMLGNQTGPQAANAFDPPLTAGEQTEALALRDRILTESNANDNAARRLKGMEFENVLILFRQRTPPYTTVASVKARLGVT